MKHTIYLILLVYIMLSSCYHKCKTKNINHYAFVPEMETYFGMYKNDNWWVYLNQDSTKRDSVYITNFNELENAERFDGCYSWPKREFNLNSTYLFGGPPLKQSSYENNANCCKSDILMGGGKTGILVTMNSKIHTKPVNYYSKDIYSYISLNINNINYTNVFKNDNPEVYIAPSVGIVRYVISTDTFSLIKYKIN